MAGYVQAAATIRTETFMYACWLSVPTSKNFAGTAAAVSRVETRMITYGPRAGSLRIMSHSERTHPHFAERMELQGSKHPNYKQAM